MWNGKGRYMKLELEIRLKKDIPSVIKYRDKHTNVKQTIFMVWDSDGEPKPAVFFEGKFCHSTNKKEIKEVRFWTEIPRQIEEVMKK